MLKADLRALLEEVHTILEMWSDAHKSGSSSLIYSRWGRIMGCVSWKQNSSLYRNCTSCFRLHGSYQQKVTEDIGGENLLQTIWVEEVLLSEETFCGGKHVHGIPAVKLRHYTDANVDREGAPARWWLWLTKYLENRPLKNALTFTWGFGMIPAFRYRKSILLYLQKEIKKKKEKKVGSQ